MQDKAHELYGEPDPYMVLGECLAQAIIQDVTTEEILATLLMVDNALDFKTALDALAELKYVIHKDTQ